MVTLVGNEGDIEGLLENLVRLEYDAVAAYEDAIDRLHSEELRSKLGEFCEDHLRHISELGETLVGRARTPPQQGDAKRFMTRGKVMLGGLIGDTAVLYAVRTNEDETNAAYDRAMEFRDLPAAARAFIERARDDERHHREWLIAKLKEM